MALLPTRKRHRAVALVGLAALAFTAACGGDSGDDSKGDTSKPTGKKGGTLYYLSISDFEHLDPARNYVSDANDFSRLIYRTLLTYKSAEGLEGTEVVPDLAKDLGESNADFTKWTFTIKDGLKYEDGSAITTADIKYGVERTFSDQLPEGPRFIPDALVGGDDYKGPYKDPKGLASIETPDEKTIVFNFKEPFPDFRYAAALPTTAPVPKAKDTGIKYDNRPWSSGPYKIESYNRGKDIKLVRNPNWDPATDPARGAYPDVIIGQLGLEGAVIDQRIADSNGPDAAAVTFKAVGPESIAKFQADPKTKSRLLSGYDNALTYTTINVTKKPLDNVKVRQAINYAWPKFDARKAAGGPTVGDFATDILVPTLKAHKKFDLYPTDGNKGDPEKAKALLAEAGYPNGITVSLGVVDSDTGKKVAAVNKAGLEKAGIKVDLKIIDPSKYYDTIGNPKEQPDLVNYGWIPDWPSPSTVIPPLFTCDAIQPQGNTNPANFCDKDFDAKVEKAKKETDTDKADELWAELDKELMEKAVVVPRYYSKTLNIYGTSIKNPFLHLAYGGQIDLANVSVL